MSTEPTTEAGKEAAMWVPELTPRILAIEAEAAALERERLRQEHNAALAVEKDRADGLADIVRNGLTRGHLLVVLAEHGITNGEELTLALAHRGSGDARDDG